MPRTGDTARDANGGQYVYRNSNWERVDTIDWTQAYVPREMSLRECEVDERSILCNELSADGDNVSASDGCIYVATRGSGYVILNQLCTNNIDIDDIKAIHNTLVKTVCAVQLYHARLIERIEVPLELCEARRNGTRYIRIRRTREDAECCRRRQFRTAQTAIKHGCSMKHIATLFNVSITDMKEIYKKLKKESMIQRNRWTDNATCPICYYHTTSSGLHGVQLKEVLSESTVGLSDEVKAMVAEVFNGEYKSLTQNKLKTMFRLHKCSRTCNHGTQHLLLLVCNGEVYETKRVGIRWRKLPQYKRYNPAPLNLEIACDICNEPLRKIKNTIYVTTGMTMSKDAIVNNSMRFVCDHCREHNEPNGCVYRYFKDDMVMRFCISESKWTPNTYRIIGNNRDRLAMSIDRDSLNDVGFLYDDKDTTLDRLRYHVQNKIENNHTIDITSLTMTVEPFVRVVGDKDVLRALSNTLQQFKGKETIDIHRDDEDTDGNYDLDQYSDEAYTNNDNDDDDNPCDGCNGDCSDCEHRPDDYEAEYEPDDEPEVTL